ncbi:amino acid adenylation domain-containing protein [Dactylosporangium sp. CA-092794]|uniref:amino acid adenylation domain-containing protein n=1 Tax=Dactylosporangium sp. CA-092794 TaxID=3239929 RepID=UPI003D8E140F
MSHTSLPHADPTRDLHGSGGGPVIDDRCLPDLLRDQVARRPGDIAVVGAAGCLTYAGFAAAAGELAAYLQHLGVRADDRVGVFVEPSTDLMVGVWGVLCAGAAYLPLLCEYPRERLRHMISDARARVVVTQPGLRSRLAELAPAGTVIVTREDAQGFGGHLDRAARPTDLAYVIYTSGSTGKPKGVLIEHRAIVNQMRWLEAEHRIGPERTVLQKTPIGFDAAQWEILALGLGSRVVAGGPGLHRDPERLIETIVAHGVTTLQCVPTLLRALVDTPGFDRCTSLVQLFSGGEVLSRRLALDCFRVLPDVELVNLYGPTECTINASAFRVDRDQVADGPPSISIGAPVYHTRYHILGADRLPVAVGDIGELYIGGVQLARGYLRQPELTAERFVDNPFRAGPDDDRLYRTGDLAYWNTDGTVQFVGRTDNQVKLRGFRIELDEIRRVIETHDWVRNAAVVVRADPRGDRQDLIAFIELNPLEAALMDQGNHAAHHQSKQAHLQTRAQLSDAGFRDADELADRPWVDLPGRVPTPAQRREVFARKTYRFFEGGELSRSDLVELLGRRRPAPWTRREPAALDLAELGGILRYFGQFHSVERLLPKYGYASPGALYATQLYLELNGVAGLAAGWYYYHPAQHRLVLMDGAVTAPSGTLRVHFLGKRRAIEPIYQNNVDEVLEIEAGHMAGLFDEILPRHGLRLVAHGRPAAAPRRVAGAADDHYIGAFDVLPDDGSPVDAIVDVYVQPHAGRVADLPAGQYRYTGHELVRVADEIILERHVIAINQQVYARSAFGIALVSHAAEGWRDYLDLGRALHRLQANVSHVGLMSAGYSSKSGHPLPAATRLAAVLAPVGRRAGPCYFAVAGPVSEDQVRGMGMAEDVVHMKGPLEMIRDDLVNYLPDYMMPNKVVILDRLPLTASGKIDTRSLAELEVGGADREDRPFVAPRTDTERRIGDIWRQVTQQDRVSVHDDFFECGGNSLIAVALVNRINREFRRSLPLQSLFTAPTVERLARLVDGGRRTSRSDGAAAKAASNRLIRLAAHGPYHPIFCWPGLGGYVMNLRTLARRIEGDRPFFGVQAHGINDGEEPYATLAEMAARDLELIRERQPTGPYTLWGYSFGARVAFETAYHLERSGDQVENLFLIAPGSPRIPADGTRGQGYRDSVYLTVLFSVFAGGIDHPLLRRCLAEVSDADSFIAFVVRHFTLDPGLVRRVVRVVEHTYKLSYAPDELADRPINAPITIFKAGGDEPSFLENAEACRTHAPGVVALRADHYGLLRGTGVEELAASVVGAPAR